MKQKFARSSFVHVCDKMPNNMSHFDSGFDAIVGATYSQLFGGGDITSYSLYKIESGKIVNQIAWYKENQLSLLPEQNRDKAEEMIEQYNLEDS